MMTMFKKELRDLLPWIAVGLILMAALCWQGKVDTNIAFLFTIGCAAVAFGLGLLQTVGDLRTEAKGYLLHRPLSTGRVFLGKIMAGIVAYCLCILPPLIGLMIYRATIGPEISPHSAWDVVPALLMALIAFAFHPAAIWTMCRPAKWFGTKAIPVAVVAIGCCMNLGILEMYVPSGYRMLAWLGFGATTIATLVLAIMAAAEAFCHRQFLPSSGIEGHRLSANNAGILTACVVGITTLGITVLTAILPNDNYPFTEHQIVMTADGQLWDFAQTQRTGDDYWNPEIAVAKIPETGELQLSDLGPQPTDWQECRSSNLTSPRRGYEKVWDRAFQFVCQFEMSYQRRWNVHEHRNRLFVYSGGGLVAVVTPEGFFDSLQEAKGSFDSVHRQWSSGDYASRSSRQNSVGIGDSLLGDANGLYQIDWKARTIRTVIQQPNDGLAFVLPASDQDAVLWVRSGNEISRHKIKPLNPEEELELRDSEIVARSQSVRLPEVTVAETKKWSFPSTPSLSALTDDPQRPITVSETPDGKTLFALIPTYQDPEGRYQIRLADGALEKEADFTFPERRKPSSEIYSAAVAPPALVATFGFFTPGVIGIPFLALLVAHCLLALAIAFWLSRRYELPAASRNLWLIAAILLGIGAPLAMVMCYPRVIRETCHHCNGQRRIDRSRCRSCGADWLKPPVQGNEIIGAAKAGKALAPSMS